MNLFRVRVACRSLLEDTFVGLLRRNGIDDLVDGRF